MYYGLVYEGNIVVGPRLWSWSTFLDFLQENQLDASALPRSAPDEPIFTEQWKLLPANDPYTNQLILEPNYQQYAGPYWEIHEDRIEGRFEIMDTPIETIKGLLRHAIMDSRYKIETMPLEIQLSSDKVKVEMTREARDSYLLKYLTMNDGDTAPWKFKDKFVDITKSDLKIIVDTVNQHVQSCFQWEMTQHTLVGQGETIEQLKAIEIKHPMDNDHYHYQ